MRAHAGPLKTEFLGCAMCFSKTLRHRTQPEPYSVIVNTFVIVCLQLVTLF